MIDVFNSYNITRAWCNILASANSQYFLDVEMIDVFYATVYEC